MTNYTVAMMIISKISRLVENITSRQEKSGFFWEDRGDRYHCGLDFYAPFKSHVFAIESGQIVSIHPFTSPRMIPYWNDTIALVLEGESGYLYKYAELDSVDVNISDHVKAGDILGRVGRVLKKENIDKTSPVYIQQLIHSNHASMLHFEVYRHRPFVLDSYCGGNLFSESKPENLCDPAAVCLDGKP